MRKKISKESMTDEEKKRRTKKIKSVRHLAQNIHKLRNAVRTDLRSDDEKKRLTALAVALMDKTAERVGNESSAREHGHFGVTGFRNNHVEVNGNNVKIDYVGKSGVKQSKSFSDKAIADAIKKCKGNCKNKNDNILTTSDGFKIRANRVNQYLERFDITAKDIRGYSANKMMQDYLTKTKKPSTPEERKKVFLEGLKKVAERVGHGKNTLRLHYLLPNVEKTYINSGRVINIKKAFDSRQNAEIQNILEDVHPETSQTLLLKKAMEYWDTARNYPVGDWKGAEKFYFWLAVTTNKAALETYGKDKFSSSLEESKGNAWRVVVPHEDAARKAIVLDINSIDHDGVSTLGTQIYSTNDIDLSKLNWIGSGDHWTRSILWLIEEAKLLSAKGEDLSKVINGYTLRLEIVRLMHVVRLELTVEMKEVYKAMTGAELIVPSVTIALNDWNFTPESVASLMYPSGDLEWAVVTVSPKAFKHGMGYVRHVIMHELIHLAIGEGAEDGHGHNAKFNMLAEAMGLPKQFRD